MNNTHLVEMAMMEYNGRKAGTRSPKAHFMEGGWRVSPEEQRSCCHGVGAAMLYRHCFSVRHVAALFGIKSRALSSALSNKSFNEREQFTALVAYDGNPSPFGFLEELIYWLSCQYPPASMEPAQAQLLGRLSAAKSWSKSNWHLLHSYKSRPEWLVGLIEEARLEINRLVGPNRRVISSGFWWMIIGIDEEVEE